MGRQEGNTIVVVYDFISPGSRSAVFCDLQLLSIDQYARGSADVLVLHVGEPPARTKRLLKALHIPSVAIAACGPPVPRIPFSRKLHLLDERAVEIVGKSRVFLVDHDVLFIAEPSLLRSTPRDHVGAKLDPLRHFSPAAWDLAERAAGMRARTGYFVPSFNLAHPQHGISNRLYFNGGVILLPEGEAGWTLLREWRRCQELLAETSSVNDAMRTSDQAAFAFAVRDLKIDRLSPRDNFMANDILDGFRADEVALLHFAGNGGASMKDAIESFRQNARTVLGQIRLVHERTYFEGLADGMCDLAAKHVATWSRKLAEI